MALEEDVLPVIKDLATEGNPSWFLPREIVVHVRNSGKFHSANEVADVLAAIAAREKWLVGFDVQWQFGDAQPDTYRVYRLTAE